mgnify:CR=1 FL=1
MSNIIKFPEPKQLEALRAVETAMKGIKELYDGLETMQASYWKLVTKSLELNQEYQILLADLIKVVGIESVPKHLLEFVHMVVDPRTGEIIYQSEDE